MYHQNLANLTIQYQQTYLIYCYKVMQYLRLLEWMEQQHQSPEQKVKPKSALGVKKLTQKVNQGKPSLKSLKHQEKPNVSTIVALGFPNGAMSAAFRVAFNEAITKNDSLDSKLTVVAHLDDEGDKVGHAFVILENADGERIARGFWPGKRNGEKYRSIIIGNGFSGAVRDEVDTGYLERYDAWLKTGVDPVRGRFAHRTYNISSKQYGSATSLINNWNKSYNLGCMCGTFTEAVAASTGNILFNNDIRSKRYTAPRPTAIFNLLKDN